MGNHKAASNVAEYSSEVFERLDECQFIVHPRLIKAKVFEDEKQAKEFTKQQQGCSAVGHGSKGYYVGLKTVPVDAIDFGIAKACKDLKLNVDLGFEWIPGTSWAQCH